MILGPVRVMGAGVAVILCVEEVTLYYTYNVTAWIYEAVPNCTLLNSGQKQPTANEYIFILHEK